MLTKKITSLQHPLVKYWTLLRTDRTYRSETQRVLVVGEKMIRELSVDTTLHTLITQAPTNIRAEEHYEVREAVFKKIAGLSLSDSDGFAAVVALPQPQDLRNKKFLLVLDRISDPGNLGTLLRTALALQWEGVIVTPGTVDLFNDKALRAAKGATFRLPYAQLNLAEAEILLKKFHVYTADLEGEKLESCNFTPPLALILSNEAFGPGNWSEKLARKITIPMSPKVESLNVASSGAILLYAMRQQ